MQPLNTTRRAGKSEKIRGTGATLDMQKFLSIPGNSVQIDDLRVVYQVNNEVSFSRTTVASEMAADNNFNALAMISADIAAAIRGAAGQEP